MSVYGAFLLEAKRSIDFEREQLIGKLEVLLDEITFDSLAFHDMTENIDSDSFNADADIFNWLRHDSLALAYLKA